MRVSIRVAIAAFVVAAGLLVIFLRVGGPKETAALPPSDDLRAVLAAQRFDFLVPTEADWSAVDARGISANDAAAAAIRELGRPPAYQVYLGRLTDRNVDTANGVPVMWISNRLAYAVQMTGLQIPPLGMPATAENVHQEKIVFIDAFTGEFLLATTFR